MQTRIVLLALLSACIAPALAQIPSSAALMQVDRATQRLRDQDRAAILQSELASESLALEDARRHAHSDVTRADPRAAQELAQRIASHRRNISALARELVTTEARTGGSATRPQVASPKPSPQRTAEERLLSGASTRADAKAISRRPLEPPQAREANRGTPEWLIPAAPVGTPK